MFQPLMNFLEKSKSLACRISGNPSTGEASSTMADYRAKLSGRMRSQSKGNPGTFFLDTSTGQAEVSEAMLPFYSVYDF